MSHGRGGQGGCERGDAPPQAVLLSDHLSPYKGARDSPAVPKDDVARQLPRGRVTGKGHLLWEQKTTGTGPKSKPAAPKRVSVLTRHSPQKGMGEKMSSSESATEM